MPKASLFPKGVLIGIPIVYSICLILTISQHQYSIREHGWPTISETGVYQPEKTIFTFGFTSIALVLAIFTYPTIHIVLREKWRFVRSILYAHEKRSIKSNYEFVPLLGGHNNSEDLLILNDTSLANLLRNGPMFLKINKLSMYIGMLDCIGLLGVSLFNTRDFPTVHIVFMIIFFFCATINVCYNYMLSKVVLDGMKKCIVYDLENKGDLKGIEIVKKLYNNSSWALFVKKILIITLTPICFGFALCYVSEIVFEWFEFLTSQTWQDLLAGVENIAVIGLLVFLAQEVTLDMKNYYVNYKTRTASYMY